jgi:hypothetical protein
MGSYFSYGSGSSSIPTYSPEPLTGGGQLDVEEPQAESSGAGKGSIDIIDPVGSVVDTVGSMAGFAGGLIGGVAGAIGSIGPDGETASIGQLAEDVGRIPGGIGDLQLPYLGPEGGQAATISQIPGAMYEPIYQVQQAAQRQLAKERVERFQNPDPRYTGRKAEFNQLPPDLAARLEAGESVDAIAEELVARNAGFSDDPVTQFASEVALDPLNLIAPGVGKGLQVAKAASKAIYVPQVYAGMGIPARAAGVAYDTISRGMSSGAAAFMDKALGPATSGAFHALGTGSYNRFSLGLRKLDRGYATALDDAAAVANANLLNAVMADDIAADIAAGLAKADTFADDLGVRLDARRAYKPDELERRAEELLQRSAPDFLGMSTDDLTDFTARALARATGASYEDALRIVGKATVKDAQTAHWLRYGKAIDEFGEAREAALLDEVKNIDVERLTLIADDTLTVERAAALAKATPGTLYDEAMRYEVLRNHFLGKHPSDGDILDFVKKLKKEGALHEAVKAPKSGKNKLPGPLSEFRQRWAGEGYDLGFAPKDGMKVLKDDAGNVLWSKPFVNVTTRRDPATIANPLGRMLEGGFRGITQARIVQESRQRMVQKVVEAGLPISPNQVRSIHKAIIDEAADRSVTPRALVGEKQGGEVLYDSIFKRFLSSTEYEALTAKFDPTFLVMRSFEGNWNTVGLTQKLTGRAKVLPVIAKIAEALYPKARFTYRPTFQLQEMIESPVLNALRGVTGRAVDPELAKAYRAMAEMPEFKYLEAAEYLNIAGDRLVTKYMGANTALGRALGRFKNIQGAKEQARVRQVLAEHGPEFKEAVQQIDPRAWAAMEEAYGTTDPHVIADRFLEERIRLGAAEDIDEAMAAVDEVAAANAAPSGGVPKGYTADPAAFGDSWIDLSVLPEERGMWHATTNLSAVRAGGLKSRVELGHTTKGLGGGMVDLGRYVSVTVNEGHAQEIAARLTLASRAARKETTIDEILDAFPAYDDPYFMARAAGVEASDEFDEVIEAIAAKYGDDHYELVRRLDEGLADMFDESEVFSGRVGLTASPEEMAALDPSNIGVVRVAAKDLGDRYKNEGLVRNVGPDVNELQFESGDLVVLDDDAVSAGQRIQQAYDEGDIARGQAENVAEGVRRGGTAESGGAIKPSERPMPTIIQTTAPGPDGPAFSAKADDLFDAGLPLDPDPVYVYHAAPQSAFRSIGSDGLRRGEAGGGGLVYVADSAPALMAFLPRRGPVTVFRMRRSAVAAEVTKNDVGEDVLGELVVRSDVPPGVLEYRGDDGAWHRLVDEPTPTSAAAAPKEPPVPAWAAASPQGEAVWQAFRDSFRQASIQGFKTHFFNPQRGWVERSLNHPYLGIYPLSYMWGKILPEFARFLLVRPFGKNVPLVGAVNLQRVQQAYLGALAEDPEFSQFMQDNAESIYFANLLFPGNPVNLTANAPAYLRHISEDAAAGRPITGETIAREVADTGSYAFGGAVKDVEQATKVGADLVDIGQDIFANLERAAREFDGMSVPAPR